MEAGKPAADHANTQDKHQKTVNLLHWHLSYGQNAQLLAYSAETLPVVMHHLQMAKDLQARLVLMDQRPRE